MEKENTSKPKKTGVRIGFLAGILFLALGGTQGCLPGMSVQTASTLSSASSSGTPSATNPTLGIPTGTTSAGGQSSIVITFISPSPAASTTVTSDVFTFTVVQNGQGGLNPVFQCSLDGTALSTCGSPVGVVVAVGNHTFQVSAMDLNGDVTLSALYKWTVIVPSLNVGPTITGWIPCANEGETCQFSGSRRVLYGVSSTYENAILTFNGSALCSSATFNNPLPNNWDNKRCWYEGTVTNPAPAAPLMGPQIDLTRIPAPAEGWNSDRVMAVSSDPSQQPAPTDIGSFREACDYSHMSFNDPIVFPGQPGASHLHVFFGNTGADANSTAETIANGGTSTCSGGLLNRTAYWTPAIIDTANGTPIRPIGLLTYYKLGYNGLLAKNIKVLPPGLRMTSGSPKNAAIIPYGRAPGYACVSDTSTGDWTQSIPDCPVGSQMWMRIIFPQCWDGVNFGFSKSSIAYGRYGKWRVPGGSSRQHSRDHVRHSLSGVCGRLQYPLEAGF